MWLVIACGVIVCSYLIWLASDWIGRGAEIIGHGWNPGVRGATISAVSSSLPELFVTLMFLNILHDEEGFLGGLATMTGSAIFNILLIPGAMGVVALMAQKHRKGEVSRRVVLRDGTWLVFVQLVLLVFLNLGRFGIVESSMLLALYCGYVFSLFHTNKKRGTMPFKSHRQTFAKQVFRLVIAGVVVLGVSCYFLVEGCVLLSEMAGWGLAATALIVAAAATSLPDTFISIREAMGGSPVEGVSNAFGSNIFDLCVALGLPVFLYTVVNGPVELSVQLQHSLIQLWYCMIGLTVTAIVVLALGRSLTWLGSISLLAMYVGFVVSVLAGLWGHIG